MSTAETTGTAAPAPTSVSIYSSSPPLPPPKEAEQFETPAHDVSATSSTSGSTDAASKLAEAIDDFLGDLEKKFKGISDEVLSKLDDMAERCDRLEAEMMVKETVGAAKGEGEGEGNDIDGLNGS